MIQRTPSDGPGIRLSAESLRLSPDAPNVVLPEVHELFSYVSGRPNIGGPRTQDRGDLAAEVFSALGIERTDSMARVGRRELSKAVIAGFTRILPEVMPWHRLSIDTQPITHFAQYRHLDKMQRLLTESDPDGLLRSHLGLRFILRPDVAVGIEAKDGPSFLHAVMFCEWRLRRERVHNIRREGTVLSRHRRGRQPHIVVVTTELLPSRIASIARGTGEVDCVYHCFLSQLWEAVDRVAPTRQREILEELVVQDRLRPLTALPEVLASF